MVGLARDDKGAGRKRSSVDATTERSRRGGPHSPVAAATEATSTTVLLPLPRPAATATTYHSGQQRHLAFLRVCTPRRSVLISAVLSLFLLLVVLLFSPSTPDFHSSALLTTHGIPSRVQQAADYWSGLVRVGSNPGSSKADNNDDDDAEQGGEFGQAQARLSSTNSVQQAQNQDATSGWVRGIEPPSASTRASQWPRGTDGDRVVLADGSSFIYRNKFGGTFDADPFSYNARPQVFSKSLAEEWDWETDRVRGVNLGGWLSLEPFITPALFERYLDHESEPARDEWTLSELVRADRDLGPDLSGRERLEKYLRRHYDEFITERDFAEIAAAGLNWIRLPFPYWAIETWDGEPFLDRVAWEYVVKAVEWARKYGLRINLDLHAVPGSQNGWNHSGKLGPINFLQSVMGLANAQRTLDYLALVAEWSVRDGVKEVVGMLSLVNEVPVMQVGETAVKSFYAEAYERIRNVTGYGAGNGPVIAFHDGFKGTRRWAHFLETQSTYKVNVRGKGKNRNKHTVETKSRWTGGLDRVALDSHRYLAFVEPDLSPLRDQVMKPCLKWAADYNRTFSTFGIPISGEFSLAVNDCGRFLNNVGQGTRLEGTFPNATRPIYPAAASLGACDHWERYDGWDDQMKATLRDFALAQMDTFQNWFYWTWKTGRSSLYLSHLDSNPLWSYSLGLRQGWIPQDPREAAGFCFSHPREGIDPKPRRFARRPTDPWKVGQGLGGGPISHKVRARDRALWPPRVLNGPGDGVDESEDGLVTAELPVYAASDNRLMLLRGPVGSRKPTESLSRVRPLPTCDYPDAWAGQQLWSYDERCAA